MSYRNGTYTAFYVDEPCSDNSSAVTKYDFATTIYLRLGKKRMILSHLLIPIRRLTK